MSFLFSFFSPFRKEEGEDVKLRFQREESRA
jgi:hypothetical protein